MTDTSDGPRSLGRRIEDTRRRLDDDVDVWVATADPSAGTPWLVPLSFLWDGTALLLSTPEASATARNAVATSTIRLALGPTRDVTMIDGRLESSCAAAKLASDLGDRFAEKTDFDPRTLKTPYRYLWVRPVRVQAWREADELVGRDLMRDGRWLG